MKIFILLATLFVSAFSQNCNFPDGSECPNDGEVYKQADPEDCTSYYSCLDDCPEKHKCERNYLYNEETANCEDPTMVECGDRPCTDPIHCQNDGPTTAGPTGTTDACDHFMDCTQFPDGWYPDTYNCRKYWHCYQGKGEHKTCPAGQLYNAEEIMCDYEDRVDCEGRPVCGPCDDHCHTQTPPTTLAHGCPGHGECTQDGLFEEGCCESTFCQCFGGIGYIQHCEPPLVFNGYTETCDFTFNVDCCSK